MYKPRPTPAQPEITKREEEIWQEISDFVKSQDIGGARMDNEGLASTVETMDKIRLDKISISVNIVSKIPKIKVIIGEGTLKGKQQIQKAIIDFVVGRYPEAEIEFN